LETTRPDLDLDLATGDEPVEVDAIEPLPTPPQVAPLTEARFLEVIAVVFSLTVASLAKRIVNRWLDDQSEGVLIDARQSPPLVSRVAGIPAGFLVLVDASGATSTHQAGSDTNESLTELIRATLSSGD
jgi:hypothetical protein